MFIESNRFKEIFQEGVDYVIDDAIVGPGCDLSSSEVAEALFPLLGEDIISLTFDVKKNVYIFTNNYK